MVRSGVEDLFSRPGYCMFIASRRQSLAEAGEHRTAAQLQAEWQALSSEERAELESCSQRRSAADVRQTLLQQKEQIQSRQPVRPAPQTRVGAKHKPLAVPVFPAKRAVPEGCSREDLEDNLRRQATAAARPRPCGDLETESAQILGPRLSFDWEDQEEGSAELIVTPAEGADLRELLKQELQRTISIQQVESLKKQRLASEAVAAAK
eukprot:s372_g9.t1